MLEEIKIVNKMNKISLLLITTLLVSGIFFAQEKNAQHLLKGLTLEQYEVVNDIFSSKSHLLSETDYSKSWSFLMTPEILDNKMLGHCTEGNRIIKCSEILKDKDWSLIQSRIRNLRPLKLEKSKLSSPINFYSNITENVDAYRITAPIIVQDYAFFKHSSIDNETIIIAKKVSGKWEEWCRKNVFIVTY